MGNGNVGDGNVWNGYVWNGYVWNGVGDGIVMCGMWGMCGMVMCGMGWYSNVWNVWNGGAVHLPALTVSQGFVEDVEAVAFLYRGQRKG